MARSSSPRETAVSEAKVYKVEVLNADGAPSLYANNTGIETSVWDVKIRFAETLAVDHEQRITRVRELATVRMSPQHAKVVAGILIAQLENYEKRFGKIPSPPGE
jgi:hypothetical protein